VTEVEREPGQQPGRLTTESGEPSVYSLGLRLLGQFRQQAQMPLD
jgi:hypothetical protein